MSLTKIEEPWNSDEGHYVQCENIGSGAYGTVFKAIDRRAPNKMVALKKIRVPLSGEGMPQSLLREIATLKQFEHYDHRNIVRLLDVCHGLAKNKRELYVYLVFEYCEYDLATYLLRHPVNGDDNFLVGSIISQLLCGLDFLHAHSIVHRDVKPQNVLVTKQNADHLIIKLTDFGLSRLYSFQTSLTPVVVTLWYRAPELLLKSSYTTAIDVWRPIFPGQSEVDQLQKILAVVGSPAAVDWPADAILPYESFPRYPFRGWHYFMPQLTVNEAQFLSAMLCFSFHRRISAANALKHPYFARWNSLYRF